MTCTSSNRFYQPSNQVPISFTQWKTILSRLPFNDDSKLSSSTSFDLHRRSASQIKRSERQLLPRNQVFSDGLVDSFFASSSINISRQDVPKILAPSSKRFISSLKTFVNSSNIKQTQRLNYINDSVMIFKLSKNQANDNHAITNSQFASKHSNLSMATTSTMMSIKQQQPTSAPGLSPLLKIEGQKHRIAHHDSTIIVPSNIDISIPSNITNQMTTSTSNQPQTNPSVFTYRSAAAGGNPVRQRAIAETTSNSLLLSAERFKSNISTSIRQTRQQLTTTALSSTYISSQQTRNTKSRVQQEKVTNSRESYEYPDPFTNCPQDVLNKLSQLTKLQLETIDWERKKRFINTKKKPLTNGNVQGKDSPQ